MSYLVTHIVSRSLCCGGTIQEYYTQYKYTNEENIKKIKTERINKLNKINKIK